MTIFRMRRPSTTDALQRVILADVEYQLRWRYIQIEDRWALDIRSANGAPLAEGIRVVQGLALLGEVRAGRGADEFPPGELFVDDRRTTARREPRLAELGTDLAIYYVDPSTLELAT